MNIFNSQDYYEHDCTFKTVNWMVCN